MGLIWFVVGYLVGSVSGARIIGRGRDLTGVQVVVSGTGETAPLGGVSSSALLAIGGPRAGLLAGAIDILKGVVAVGAALVVAGSDPAAWAGLGVCVGHVYPVWHRFRGGFGMSPLIGALVVLDPIGLIVSLAIGILLGAALGSAFTMTEMWLVFLVPWALWQGRSGAFTWFVAVATALYMWRTRSELVVAWGAWWKDSRPWSTRVADVKKYPDYLPRRS